VKYSLFCLFIFLSSYAFSQDLSQKQQEFCESDVVKKRMDPGDQCRILLDLVTMGNEKLQCQGQLQSIACRFTYISENAQAAVELVCGTDLENPMLYQILPAAAKTYQVTAIISKANGEFDIVQQASTHSYVETELATLTRSINKNGEQSDVQIQLNLYGSIYPLSNINCQ
jgi:hypothetical protein